MKKALTIALFFAFSGIIFTSQVKAQWVLSGTGSSGKNTTLNRIGIGTTFPQYKLHVIGNGLIIEDTSDIGPRLSIRNMSKDPTDINNWTLANIGAPYAKGLHFFRYNGVNATSLVGAAFSIADNGNIGIGTGYQVAPSEKLEVKTAAQNDGIAIKYNNNWAQLFGGGLTQGAYNSLAKTDDAGIIYGGSTAGTNKGFIISPWSNTASGIRFDENGNIGIGTNSPAAPLHLYKQGQTIRFLTGSNNSAYTMNVGVNDDGVNFYNNSAIRGFNFSNMSGQSIKFLEGTNTSGYTLGIGVNDNGVNISNNSAIRGFNFINNNGTLLKISEAGDVAIGPGTGNGKLDVGFTPNKNTAVFRGSQNASVFNYGGNGGSEDIIIEAGKSGSKVYINDVAGVGDINIGNGNNKLAVNGQITTTNDIGSYKDLYATGNLYFKGTNPWLFYTGDTRSDLLFVPGTTTAQGLTWNWNNQISFTNNGKIILGPDGTLTPAGYRLIVKEGILTEKVKVAVANSSQWADYVFNQDYKLPSLCDVETYINTNKHLPGIPSAADMVKDGNDLGKTDAKLLEKIEELTLYIISLQKQVDSLNKKSDQQEIIIEQLKQNRQSK